MGVLVKYSGRSVELRFGIGLAPNADKCPVCPVVFQEDTAITYKYWDSANLRQGTSYQCRDTDPNSDPYLDP